MSSVKNRILSALIIFLLVQISTPVNAATPATIQIETHDQSVTTDQIIRFTAVVKDSMGIEIDEVVNWTVSSGTIDSEGFFTPGQTGIAFITATSGNVNSTSTIDVIAGHAVDIQSNINTTDVSIEDVVQLNATLVDRAGNPVSGELIWRCQNGEIDYYNNTWKPGTPGNATMRIIHSEIEQRIIFNISPGEPNKLELPYGLTVQSGLTVHIIPTAKDSMDYEVDISKAGTLYWQVENGTISPTGLFFGNSPGLWNVTVNSSSGASGSGLIRVLPAQAIGLDLEINSTEIMAGVPVKITAIRTDILGNAGEVSLPLSNWSVPSGAVAIHGNSIIWTPTQVGLWTVAVTDQGYSTIIQVNVTQGFIVGAEVHFSEEQLRSGEVIIATLSVYDTSGNQRVVKANWTLDPKLGYEEQYYAMKLQPGLIGNYSITATWFDNQTKIYHEILIEVQVFPGELSRITLPISGTKVTSDGALELLPIFEDEYGNTVDPTPVNWLIDGIDMTAEINLAENQWAPKRLGMHEITAISKGVFAITDIEVIPGITRQITTDFEDGIDITSGKEIDITIFSLDIHGNIAPAADIVFDFGDPSGIISPSSKGEGVWTIEGGKEGTWNLRISSDLVTHDIDVRVTPGDAVRILAEIPSQNPEEGGTMIIKIHAIDNAGNRIEVAPDDIEIDCTTGEVRHLSNDNYEIAMEQSGQSQSCNIYWSNLSAQRFYDVDTVLFSGGLGDSNTALTLVSIIILLFIAIMLVLIRRIKDEHKEAYWDEEELEENEDQVAGELASNENDTTYTTNSEAKDEQIVESSEDIRTKLTAEAKRTGVMQAAPGTNQGKTGWYIDSTGELTSWLVSESGEWTRMS